MKVNKMHWKTTIKIIIIVEKEEVNKEKNEQKTLCSQWVCGDFPETNCVFVVRYDASYSHFRLTNTNERFKPVNDNQHHHHHRWNVVSF